MARELVCVKGQTIVKQNTPAHEAYYLKKGRVQVSVIDDGQPIMLSEIGPGEIFGEIGVIDKEMRTANVEALENCELTVISKEELETKLEEIDDEVISALINALSRRLRDSTQNQIKHYRELADFQDRMSRISSKAGTGIDKNRREEFAKEVEPLLTQLEATLDKYRK